MEWYIKEGTYLRRYFEINSEYFPLAGIDGKVYIADLDNFEARLQSISALSTKMEGMKVSR